MNLFEGKNSTHLHVWYIRCLPAHYSICKITVFTLFHMILLQMKALLDLKDRFHIDINIDKDRGMAILHGTKDEISAASDAYHKIIRDAERNIQEGLQAKLISDYVQWYYVDNADGKNELIEYPRNINLIIERAYCNQDKEVKFRDKGTEYAINFNNMEKYPTVNKFDVTTVIRRDKIKGIYNHIMIFF